MINTKDLTKEDQMIVKVSGTAVYKAVKQHLKDSDQMKALIEDTVKEYIKRGLFQEAVDRVVKEKLGGYYNDTLKKVVAEVVDKEVKLSINDEIQKAIKKTLQESVFVMPKV